MRLAFLTQDDPLYILPFFEEFLRSYSHQFEIVAISCCPTMGNRSRRQMVRELTSLYGVGGFTRLALLRLWARVRGHLRAGRGATRYYGLQQLARAYEVPYESIGNPNCDSFRQATLGRGADIIVSVACPYILKEPLLSTPQRGCINIHHAPLPFYKGMMPSFWQMYDGAGTSGVTIHFMGSRLDEGDAILQDAMPIVPGETLHSLIRRSKRNGAHVMARALHLLETGVYQRKPLGGEGGSYYSFPKAQEIANFRRRGLRAI